VVLNDWLREKRTETLGDSTQIQYTYEERILAVCGDATGAGDMPNETLEAETRLPLSIDSHVKLTLQSKDRMYKRLQQALYAEPGDENRFTYPANHPLAAEFEEQMCGLVREYKGDGEYLSVHHPEDDPSSHDDAPDALALAMMAASEGEIGQLLVA
jgi:hypothetical protein